jgi:hypothetical protein
MKTSIQNKLSQLPEDKTAETLERITDSIVAGTRNVQNTLFGIFNQTEAWLWEDVMAEPEKRLRSIAAEIDKTHLWLKQNFDHGSEE